ncbi:MAG: anti-sigma factor [Bacteroidia bacterium]|nr:anti-sigma factor [Bacteroidia bacterium]
MNTKEVIESGILESYVLGSASVDEVALVQDLCRKHPELLKEIEAIEQSLMDLSAERAPEISSGLKDKISSQLNFNSNGSASETKVISINEASNKTNLYKFGMAASLLLFVTSLVYNVLLNQKLSEVSGELAQLNADKSVMAQEMQVQEASIKTMNDEIRVIANPMVKTVALKGMNSMDKHSAMVHWNTETEEVYFNASVLPQSPENKQYQLWAIVDGKPVDIGMIDTTSLANVFQKMKAVKGAQAFAVTIEKVGGSPVPTMETMCLLGNV